MKGFEALILHARGSPDLQGVCSFGGFFLVVLLFRILEQGVRPGFNDSICYLLFFCCLNRRQRCVALLLQVLVFFLFWVDSCAAPSLFLAMEIPPFLLDPRMYPLAALPIAMLAAILTLAFFPTKNKPGNQIVASRNRSRSSDGEFYDCIIVGAGVAGSALAYSLGKDGRKVLIVERDLSEPDRIVGELFQPGGYLKLQELGLEDCVEGIDAQRVFGYALFKEGKDTKVAYPLEGHSADVSGRSFHHGRFIQKLRTKASSLPNVKLLQGTVLSLLEENDEVKGVRYKSQDGDINVYAPITFVCDGCFSNLRRKLCVPKVEIPSCFVGLVLENCTLPYANHGHVILATPSPILFYPISSTEVRCLVDVPGEKTPSVSNGDMTTYLRTVIAPQLPKQLQDSFIAASDKSKIRMMQNRSMPAVPIPTPGALLLGDAFNMRHPLTGGGMTVAFADIALLRNMLTPLDDFHDSAALCQYLQAFYTRRKPVASTINTLAGALYKVFCDSPDVARKEMRQACFDYLSLGGVFSSGPVALLSGLNPRPLSLVMHFFAVAIFGVGRLLTFPSPKRLWIGVRLIMEASNIIFPIIKAEGLVRMFFPQMVKDYYKTPPQSLQTL